MSAQLIISEMTNEERQSAVERLSEQPLNVLSAAFDILICSSIQEEHFKAELLRDAIIHKAFENVLDPDCIPEQEKYRKVVKIRESEE